MLRFAPSPTGFLHMGNIRVALVNYLYAKKNNLPVVATNIPRKYASKVFKNGGFQALDNLNDFEKKLSSFQLYSSSDKNNAHETTTGEGERSCTWSCL